MAENETRKVETWRKTDLIAYVLSDLDKRIKFDKPTKLSVFFTAASAYLPEPTNLFLKGESGSGKSFNVVQTLRYFSLEDVWFLGGLSPKALIHGYGELLNKDGEKIETLEKPIKPHKKDFKDKPDEYKDALENFNENVKAWKEEIKQSYTLIDLSHKVLVFLESPDFNTFRMLYPILSHDTERIEYRFTDKTARGQFKQAKVIIQGWPATIFLSTDQKFMEELSTRSFTATPESGKDKIEAANILTNLKASTPWQYNHETEEHRTISALIESLKRRFLQEHIDVVIPFTNLHEFFPKQIVRDMRDFQHFTQFLKTITAIHLYQRPFTKINEKKFLISTIGDVRKALDVYMEIFETTRTNTEQRILDFYNNVIMKGGPWYVKQLTEKYNEINEKKLSDYTIRKWLERLNQIGYVDKLEDDADKRLNVYVPIKKEKEKIVAISGFSENPAVLDAELEKGFESWKNNIGKQTGFFCYKNFAEGKWGEAEISLDELEKAVVHNEIFFSQFSPVQIPILKNEDSKAISEKNAETVRTAETQTKATISKNEPVIIEKEDNKVELKIGDHIEIAYECPLCKNQRNPVLFGSPQDLSLHIQRLHGGFPDSKLNQDLLKSQSEIDREAEQLRKDLKEFMS